MRAVIGLVPAVELNLTLFNEAYIDEAQALEFANCVESCSFSGSPKGLIATLNLKDPELVSVVRANKFNRIM